MYNQNNQTENTQKLVLFGFTFFQRKLFFIENNFQFRKR